MESSARLHAEEFDRIVHAPGLAHARGVDEHVVLAHAVGLDLEGHVHGVAGRARNGGDDDALGLGERVDDRGLAHVGPPTMASFSGAAGVPRGASSLGPTAALTFGARAAPGLRQAPVFFGNHATAALEQVAVRRRRRGWR